jgi:hypothetical protein
MPEMAQIAVEVGVLGLVVPSCKKHLLQYRGTRQLGRNHHHPGCVVYKACYARVCFCFSFPFLPPSTLFVLLLLFLQFSSVSAGSEKRVGRDGSGWWWWWWQKRIAVVCSQQQKGPANTKNNAAAATKVAEKAILEERSIPAAGPLSRQPLQQQEVRCCCSVCPLSLADCSFPDIMLEWISNIVC